MEGIFRASLGVRSMYSTISLSSTSCHVVFSKSLAPTKINWYTFHSKYTTFSGFQKVEIFPLEKLFFFQTKLIFESSEEWYYFSRILQQYCYNLVETKCHAKKVSNSMIGQCQLAQVGWKNVGFDRFEWMIFFHILDTGGNINKVSSGRTVDVI